MKNDPHFISNEESNLQYQCTGFSKDTKFVMLEPIRGKGKWITVGVDKELCLIGDKKMRYKELPFSFDETANGMVNVYVPEIERNVLIVIIRIVKSGQGGKIFDKTTGMPI